MESTCSMHEKGMHTELTGKNRYEDQHVDGKIIKWGGLNSSNSGQRHGLL
jgi:hypothetical protein